MDQNKKDLRRFVNVKDPEKTAFPTLSSKTTIKKEHKNHYSFEYVVDGMPAYKMQAYKR